MINMDSNIIKVLGDYLKIPVQGCAADPKSVSEKDLTDAVKKVCSMLNENSKEFKDLKSWLFPQILENMEKQTGDGILDAINKVLLTTNIFNLLPQPVLQSIAETAGAIAPSTKLPKTLVRPNVVSSIQHDLDYFIFDLSRIPAVY